MYTDAVSQIKDEISGEDVPTRESEDAEEIEMEGTMHWTLTNRLGKSVWNASPMSLAVALGGALCVPMLAQSNTPEDASYQEAAYVFSSSPATFTSVASFDYTDGAFPVMELVQGTDGNFYGPAYKGGTGANPECTHNCGTIFKITSEGRLTTAHSFHETDGFQPVGLLQGTDGNYYGTANYGGAGSCTSYGFTGGGGTVFKMTPGGTLTTLHNFCSQKNSADGAIPWGTIVQGTDGNFYGTTIAGGAGTCKGPVGPGCGTVFKITPEGSLTTLHSFDSANGAYPYGGVLQATNGNFYGTTSEGGAHGYGTVFEITPAGTLTTLHSFNGSDGAYPSSGLVQAANGSFYGTTLGYSLEPDGGGPSCTVSGIGWGTVFEITSSGTLTTLHSFDDTDGAYPGGGLAQATDGNFYGVTSCGGAHDDGTIFKITLGRALSTLHSFDGADGALPIALLLQATSGTIYGTTVLGGTDNYGTVFSLSVGLGPFVVTRPTSGKVGTAVTILGNKLRGASKVSFDGKPSSFTVNSTSTAITTTVPSGAATGYVQVTTPSGTLTSNVEFRVP